jgi:hypothetical protein
MHFNKSQIPHYFNLILYLCSNSRVNKEDGDLLITSIPEFDSSIN